MRRAAAVPSGMGWWRRVAWLALAVSTVVPLAVLLLQSFAESWRWPALVPGAWTGRGWQSVLAGGPRWAHTGASALGRAAVTSAWLGMATAVAAVLLALPIGRAMATLPRPWSHVAAALVFLPVAAPPIALAAGLQVLTLQLGVAGSPVGVWLAHCVPAAGYAALLFTGVFSARGSADEDAARTLGASAAQVWRQVLLPQLRAPLAEALAIAFLISWAQVALTLVIGGGAVRALPIEVLTLVRAGQERDAAVGALLLVLPAMAALAALRLGVRRTRVVPV
jgi:putative spermidine/putrescine transport system permease protein